MPLVGVHREFLHCCCIQFSPALANEAAVAAEKQQTLRFVRYHATEHASEIARALVWRVADTIDEDDRDRIGAWEILNAVLLECGDLKNDLARTVLADKISLFLPYLIAFRWYSRVTKRNSAEVPATRLLLEASSFKKVVSADLITGGTYRAIDMHRAQELVKLYRGILASWERIWRGDVYQAWKQIVRSVERSGNYLDAQGKKYLEIPNTFKDSLWRLRRSTPRPGIALHILYCYGWAPQAEAMSTNSVTRPTLLRLPESMAEIEALDPVMHTGVRRWMRRFIEAKGGCRLCDTWRHTEARCPCELPFHKPSFTALEGGGGSSGKGQHQSEGPKPLTAGGSTLPFSYMEAVDKLYRCGIALPLKPEVALDRVTQLIMEEQPYEDLLTAFDVVRGAVTGPLERHALWLHAGYRLLPSKTLFDKPNDDCLSPTLEKVEHYFKATRRFREWDHLLQSVESLDTPFRRRALPLRAQNNLREIKETSSFFFCLVDGSLPASFTPGLYARVPEEVLEAAPLKDIICPLCLEPFHNMVSCPTTAIKEPWDLQVARLVLEDNNILRLRLPDEEPKVHEALRRIDQDDRQAKEFRKNELSLAVKLIHERNIPICEECGGCVGHNTFRCPVRAKKVLEKEGIALVDMRLDPSLVKLRLRQHQVNHSDDWRRLKDAYHLLATGSNAYLVNSIAAIKELDDARIPLAAARYSTDAVQGFLLYVNSGDLLARLSPLRDEDFPEVCIFCDSYHHTSEECSRAEDDEKGFLRELRCAGLNLWQYLQRTEFYDERLPSDFMQGKKSILNLVRQFAEDYGPGGVARTRFIEHNGLEALSQGGAAGNYSQSFTRLTGASGPICASPYGCSFSQLVELTPAHATGEAAATTRLSNRSPDGSSNDLQQQQQQQQQSRGGIFMKGFHMDRDYGGSESRKHASDADSVDVDEDEQRGAPLYKSPRVEEEHSEKSSGPAASSSLPVNSLSM